MVVLKQQNCIVGSSSSSGYLTTLLSLFSMGELHYSDSETI